MVTGGIYLHWLVLHRGHPAILYLYPQTVGQERNNGQRIIKCSAICYTALCLATKTFKGRYPED